MTNGSNRIWTTCAVCALLLILGFEIVHAIRGESLTWDEGDHIFSGYQIWKTHDYSFNPEHPPMVKMLAAIPLLGLPLIVPPQQGRFFKTEAYLDGRELLFRNDPAYGGHYTADSLIFRARLPILIFALAGALLVFAAGTEFFSDQTFRSPAGLIALALFCFEPTLLAHGAFVTTDMAASCTIFATVYTFWRWIKRPSWQRLLVVGLAAGLALAAKHSTVLLAPMLVVLAAGELCGRWLAARRNPEEAPALRRTALHLIGGLLALTLIAIVVLWAFYGFRYSARPAGLVLTPSLQEYVGPLAGLEAHGILLAGRLHLLPESWLYGLADVRAMANGMPSYFFGHVYAHGVWFYFPILLLIKTTLAMLAMLALTAFAILRGWLRLGWFEGGRELWFLIAPPAVYLLVAMDSHLNIGARHVLPLFIFACVLAGAGMAALIRHNARWMYVAAALLLLHIGSSLSAAPNYISYTNEAWGGPTHTYRYLTDSNTDWGQQLVATSAYLRSRHIQHCWFAYFVQPFIRFEDYGIPCKPLPTFDTMSLHGNDIAIYDVPPIIGGPNEPVLISAGTLNGFELGSSVLNPYESFRSKTPTAFIQNGVFVYDGTFPVPLASALAHVQRSAVMLKANDVAGALREAEIAEQTAPGEVQPEIALGDALTAAHQPLEAKSAYARARLRIDAMDPDARDIWLKSLNPAPDTAK